MDKKAKDRARMALKRLDPLYNEMMRNYSSAYRARMGNEKRREWAAQYRKKNRGRIREYAKKYSPIYVKHRYHTDPNFKLGIVLRERLGRYIKKGTRKSDAIHFLGCSISDLRFFIEGKFTEGMSWQNWGHTGSVWHLDHIIPLIYFDLTDPEQMRKAFHYTNLQPLWAIENLRKGGRILKTMI